MTMARTRRLTIMNAPAGPPEPAAAPSGAGAGPLRAAALPSSPRQFRPEREAARYIDMSVSFLRQARRHAREPTHLRIGTSIRYPIKDLDAWLDAHRVTTRDRVA
jgi:hypothetical protein